MCSFVVVAEASELLDADVAAHVVGTELLHAPVRVSAFAPPLSHHRSPFSFARTHVGLVGTAIGAIIAASRRLRCASGQSLDHEIAIVFVAPHSLHFAASSRRPRAAGMSQWCTRSEEHTS